MSVGGALAAKPEVEIWRRPIFRLSDPDFLFDPQYIRGLSRTVTELPLGVETAMLPTSSAHCSKLSNLIFVKFSGSLEGRSGCRMPSNNRKSIDRLPSKSRPKYTKIEISNPISPPNGGRFPPNKNHFSQGRQSYKTHWSDGGADPQRG